MKKKTKIKYDMYKIQLAVDKTFELKNLFCSFGATPFLLIADGWICSIGSRRMAHKYCTQWSIMKAIFFLLFSSNMKYQMTI